MPRHVFVKLCDLRTGWCLATEKEPLSMLFGCLSVLRCVSNASGYA